MAEGLRKTLSHSAVYGLGVGAQNVVSLLMLPIYTHFLTPADYGTLGMMQIVIDVASAIFGMQVVQGVFRNYHAARDRRAQDTVIASALAFVIANKLIGVVLLVVFAETFAKLLFGSTEMAQYMALFSVSLLTTSLFFMPFQYLRALERPGWFVSLSVVKLALQLSLNIYFVVHLRMGVPGVIWATVITGVTLGGAMAAWALVRTRFAVSLAQIRNLLGFSWPLILTGFVTLYVGAGSRALISHSAGLGQVGLFMLAQRLAGVVGSVIWRPFNQAWGAQRFKLIGTASGARTYERGFVMASVAVVTAGLALTVFAPEVLRVMSAPAFWDAATLVPLLVLQSTIATAAQFSRFGLVVEGRTIEFLKSSTASAVVASVVAVALIGALGAMAVAIALVAYALTNLWMLERNQRSTFDVPLPWRKFWGLIALATVAYLLTLLAPQGLWAAIGVKSAILFVFCATVFFSPILGREERAAVVQLVRDLLAKVGFRARA